MRKIFLLLLFAVLFMATSAAQDAPHPILETFSAQAFQNQVLLRWTIKKGSFCLGIKIFRSTDSVNFIQIGTIAGVCGSDTEAADFTFPDGTPVLNAINYYKLELGIEGFTTVVSAEVIDLGSKKYKVWPNPASGAAKVYFENDRFQKHRVLIFQPDGKILENFETSENTFMINSARILSGPYILYIISDNNIPVVVTKVIFLD